MAALKDVTIWKSHSKQWVYPISPSSMVQLPLWFLYGSTTMLSPVSPHKVLSFPPPSSLTSSPLHLLTSSLLLPVLESSVTPAAGAGKDQMRTLYLILTCHVTTVGYKAWISRGWRTAQGSENLLLLAEGPSPVPSTYLRQLTMA